MNRLQELSWDIRYWWQQNCLTAVMVTVITIMVCVVFLVASVQSGEVEAGYNAWVKQTGNPKKLSLTEWNSLRKTMQDGDTTVLFIGGFR